MGPFLLSLRVGRGKGGGGARIAAGKRRGRQLFLDVTVKNSATSCSTFLLPQ
jgi:hypothetical protein